MSEQSIYFRDKETLESFLRDKRHCLIEVVRTPGGSEPGWIRQKWNGVKLNAFAIRPEDFHQEGIKVLMDLSAEEEVYLVVSSEALVELRGQSVTGYHWYSKKTKFNSSGDFLVGDYPVPCFAFFGSEVKEMV